MTLTQLRKEIDRVDMKILNLVAGRKKLVSRIIEYKFEKRIPLVNKKREQEIISRLISGKKLSSTEVYALWNVLFGMSYEVGKKR